MRYQQRNQRLAKQTMKNIAPETTTDSKGLNTNRIGKKKMDKAAVQKKCLLA